MDKVSFEPDINQEAINENKLSAVENTEKSDNLSSEINNEVSKQVETLTNQEETEVVEPVESKVAEITDLGIENQTQENFNDFEAANSDESSDDSMDEIESSELEKHYNVLSREQLIEELNKIVQEEDINEIKNKVALIKVAFYKITNEEKQAHYHQFIEDGGNKEEYTPVEDELEVKFKAAFQIYREKKQKYNEELEKEKLENLAKKQQIIEELKQLISSEETLKKTYDEFKELQEKWKGIGQVPRSENNTMWQNYHFLVEKFFDKVKINKELKDLDLRKNLENKIQLCEKAEELILEPSILVSFKKIQQYHEEWKEIGPVPQDKKDEIWERFKNATDKINQRRQEHYQTLHEQYEKNLMAKTALCEKAEQILSREFKTLKDWQDATNEMNELLKIWKSIGQVSKKYNNEIWSRFKTYLDTFFANKSEHFAKLKDEQVHNYNLKLDLCVQAEAIKDRKDWKKATQELLDLQRQWKEIGPVPRKNQEKIWQRFRAACDEFFNNKSAYFANINENENNNLKLKEELIEKVKNFNFSDDRNENLQQLKDIQRQWSEIGHVPLSEKEKIQSEFRKHINACFDKLRISSNEAAALSYKNRIESIKAGSNGSKQLSKEKSFITGKINKLKEDISLWENNIGFLAHSKQADLLKSEFEKKIESAKQEVAFLEAKLKMLLS